MNFIKFLAIVSLFVLSGCFGTDLASTISSDSGGGDSGETTSWPDTSDHNVFVALQDTGLEDFIYEFNYDTGQAIATALSVSEFKNVNTDITGHVRGFSADINGSLIAGGTGNTNKVSFDKTITQTADQDLSATTLSNIHGICALPNGNVIIGEEVNATGNQVTEVDSLGAKVADVYSTTLGDHGALTDCFAPSNDTIFMIETAAWTIADSILLKMKKSGGSWSVDQSIQMSVYAGATNSSLWSLVVHPNGNLYAPPFRRDGTRLKKMIRCSITDISGVGCTSFGDDIPDSAGGGAATWVRGVVKIPGDDNLLVFLSQKIYHFNITTGTYTLALDLTGVLGTIDTVRGVATAPK